MGPVDESQAPPSLPAGKEIVVGIDGSAYALAAAEWAAREADSRGLAIVLVRALSWPFLDAPVGSDLTGPIESGEREAANADLAQAETRVHEAAPGVDVRRIVDLANPALLLFEASDDAAMIVVGERGRSSLVGVLAGSTAIQVATHATVPVVVVRGHTAPTGGIVVGVDDSPGSAGAIGYAFDVAARRNAPLLAVHTWSHPISTGPGDMLPLVVEGHQEAEDRMVAEALAGWSGRYPGVEVRRQTTRGHPVRTLERASAAAQLVVVGSRGHGGFAGLLLGSVGMALLHRAQCPVAIVRPAAVPDSAGTGDR